MASYYAHYITKHASFASPDHIAVVTQVLDYSVCKLRSGTPLWVVDVIDIVQITLGALMCLLVLVRFVRHSYQMYRATKRFELSRYMNLLARDGLVYFLAYVHPVYSPTSPTLIYNYCQQYPVIFTHLCVDRHSRHLIIRWVVGRAD